MSGHRQCNIVERRWVRFEVWQPAEFAGDLLPTLFKHCNFSSFVRQLNAYGFRKVATNRWEFCNEMFRKGESELLCKIRRRKSWVNKQQSGTTTEAAPECDEDERYSSPGLNNLLDENKRLKKENGVLNWELRCMKRKCQELVELMANYAQSEKEKDDEDDRVPKLFGVKLEIQGEKEKERRY